VHEQTTSGPSPQQGPDTRSENLILGLAAFATAVVLACADTPAAAAYRSLALSMLGVPHVP
jgi:hypothetical protein